MWLGTWDFPMLPRLVEVVLVVPSLLSNLPCALPACTVHAGAHRSVAHGRTLPWPHRVRDARRREGTVDPSSS